MRKTALVTVLIVSLGMFVAESAAAAPRAPVRISIDTYPGGIFGYVMSPSTRCKAHVTVRIMGERGAKDEVLARVRTNWNDGHQWFLEDKRFGEIYAKVARQPGCRRALSHPVHNVLEANGIDDCPSLTANVCQFNTMWVDLEYGDGGTFGNACPGFGTSRAFCYGKTRYGPSPWRYSSATFSWEANGPGQQRDVLVYAGGGGTQSRMFGYSPRPNYADFVVTSAYSEGYEWQPKRYSPNLPGRAPGSLGGPMYINFENSSGFGADVYIGGYLYKKP